MRGGLGDGVVAAVERDLAAAVSEYQDASTWFGGHVEGYSAPLAVEVWVVDPSRTRVLLVRHRWRGWVPPGGKAEPGELPREAARRELLEETGLDLALEERPAAAMVRSYHPDWPAALGLTYAAIADPTLPIIPEQGQPVAWTPLDEPWESCFPDDRERIQRFAARNAS